MAANLFTLLLTSGIAFFILKVFIYGGASLVIFNSPTLWIFVFIVFALIVISKRK